jgi:hypothetical protein
MQEHRTIVGVHPAAVRRTAGRLFDALEAALPVRFTAHDSGGPPADGFLAVGGQPPSQADPAPMIVFTAPDDARRSVCDVRLATDAAVDRRLHGVALAAQAVSPPLGVQSGERVLALGVVGPVWTRGRDPQRQTIRVATGLPLLEPGVTLFEALHGPDALGLIALVEFLRALEANPWRGTGLRAAFVFDDPNLRRNRYGYVDYRELIRHADEHGYHAAMNMVPLDARRWSVDAADLFRARPDRLSLVIHGNDHAPRELASAHAFETALAVGAQALRRIAWFQTRTGLTVDPVMTPPHERWSRIGARAMGALGFDAMSCSNPYPSAEGPRSADVLTGWTPASFVDGCAVLQRLPLSLDPTGIALRAFLGHPLILYGHHADLADGLAPLASAAATVNGLGDVTWFSVGEIARSNYELRADGDGVRVRPWSGRLELQRSCDEPTLAVDEPAGGGFSAWSTSGLDGACEHHRHAFGERTTSWATSIRLHSAWATDPATVPSPARSLPAVGRRRLSESRDRLVPLGRRSPSLLRPQR